MKLKHIFSFIAGTALSLALSGCEGEKDLIVIDEELPIKTQTLYMVGDATPNGWSIDSPTALTPSDEDPLVFNWEGRLNTGEMKLCLVPGSWDAGFIRPLESGAKIGKEEVRDAKFQMHAGDPDEKWRITDAGMYQLTFNLRNWTMSAKWLREPDAMPVVPIETETLYLVGDATPNGWSIDNPTPLDKTAPYIFEYTGPLTAGNFKLCTTTGSFDVDFVRPDNADVTVSREGGVSADNFIYAANPDHQWNVVDEGVYHLTFDLEHWTVKGEYKGEIVIVKNPIETSTLYMVGDATPAGWDMKNPSEFTAKSKFVFEWEGNLIEGHMKACLVKDESWSCPFIRPEVHDTEIGRDGVAAADFMFKTSPDNQWKVTAAGKYRITFDLEHWTIAVKYLGDGSEPEQPEEPGKDPLEAKTLYMVGDATPNGWSMDAPTQLTVNAKDPYVFEWQGELKTGDMKACIAPDGSWSCPFVRPAADGVTIGANGVSSPDFVYTKSPDHKWKVTEAGTYRLTFNLKTWTLTATKIETTTQKARRK